MAYRWFIALLRLLDVAANPTNRLLRERQSSGGHMHGRQDFLDFPAAFGGPVLRPGDAGYSDARAIFNARKIEDTPALIARAADEADVLTLAVAPEVRRRGLGGRLLAEATAFAATLGARVVFLEVSTANIAARTLYKKAGFLRAGLRPKYYLDLTDALVLRLDLGLPGPADQLPGLLSTPN